MLIFTNKYIPVVINRFFSYLLSILVLVSCAGQGDRHADVLEWEPVTPDGLPARTVALDTMELANPFVVYERAANRYYMTGDGGYVWTSEDLRMWTGPYNVLCTGKDVWYAGCEVSAPEIHRYEDRYCYMASFEKQGGGCASCEVLVADEITGPYIPVNAGNVLLDSVVNAGHPTFCADELNTGYMIYSDSAEPGGALKIIRFTPDLSKKMGEPFTMLANVQGDGKQIKAPYLFVTDTGVPGLLFTAYKGEESVISVAYTTNELGHWLNGPWITEPQPLINGNVGGASLFTDYDGTLVMAIHKDTLIAGRNVRVPRFVKMESQFDKLKKIGYYNF